MQEYRADARHSADQLVSRSSQVSAHQYARYTDNAGYTPPASHHRLSEHFQQEPPTSSIDRSEHVAASPSLGSFTIGSCSSTAELLQPSPKNLNIAEAMPSEFKPSNINMVKPTLETSLTYRPNQQMDGSYAEKSQTKLEKAPFILQKPQQSPQTARITGGAQPEESNIHVVVNEWLRFSLRLGVTAAMHPIEYAKVLLQLGHNPVMPKLYTSEGQPRLFFPSVFQYVGHIRKVDGFIGCYRGLTPLLVGTVMNMLASKHIAQKLELPKLEAKAMESRQISAKEALELYACEAVLATASVVLYQPFHVISLRMMAQFVGRETIYKNMLSSIAEIYRGEGFAGYFSGLTPKLAFELLCLTLTSGTVYLANKYILRRKSERQYNSAVVQFLVGGLCYPVQLISTCMAVNGSRLAAARPPLMPRYRTTMDCFYDLNKRGQLHRGGCLFWRSAGEYLSTKSAKPAATSTSAPRAGLSSSYYLPDIAHLQ